MDLRQLRYFIAIVESGSLTDAARRLNIVQPALSQRLSDLERDLGEQLLVRGRLGVAPTPAGTELYERARLILKQLESARLAVKEKAGRAEGSVSIGLLRTLAPTFGGPLFLALKQRLPLVVPQIRVGYSAGLAQMLRQGRLDITMQVLPAGAKGKGALYSEHMCVVATPSLLPPSGPPLKLGDLKAMPLLLSSLDPRNNLVLETAQRAGIALDLVGGVEDASALLEVCESGVAATLLSESVAQRAASRRGLAYRLLDEPDLVHHVLLAVNPDVPRTATVLVVEELICAMFADAAARAPLHSAPAHRDPR